MVKIKGVGRLLAWLLNPRRQQRFVQVCHYTATQNTFIILCAFLCNLKTVFDERHEAAGYQTFGQANERTRSSLHFYPGSYTGFLVLEVIRS